MDDRLVKVFGGLVALGLVLITGVVVGGLLAYGLILLDPLPIAQAQAGDPGYGLVIAQVEPDGPSADAGVVRGDILLDIDGDALNGSLELAARVSEFEPGDEIKLTVLHGDGQRTLTAVVGERGYEPYLGLDPCTVRTAPRWTDWDTGGAVITEVLPDSPAEEAGLDMEDVVLAVGSERMDAGAELADAIAGYEPGDLVIVEIQEPDGELRKVPVTLGEHPEVEGLAYLGVRYSTLPGVKHYDWSVPPVGGNEHLEPFTMPFSVPHGVTIDGLLVVHVADESPASEAGLMAGDIIRAVDGEEVANAEELGDIVADSKPGDMVLLTVGRAGTNEEGEVDVILGEGPDEEGKAYLGVTVWPVPPLGTIEGERLPFRRFEEFEFDELPFWFPESSNDQGAIIVSVEESGPAYVAGLAKGDVITAVDGEPLEGPGELVDAIAGLEPGDKLVLSVTREDGDSEREIEVTLGEHPDSKGKAYLGVEIGSNRRMERRGSFEMPHEYRYGGEHFRFGMPFDELPFDLDEMPHWFDFHWAPGEDDCDDCPGALDDSA